MFIMPPPPPRLLIFKDFATPIFHFPGNVRKATSQIHKVEYNNMSPHSEYQNRNFSCSAHGRESCYGLQNHAQTQQSVQKLLQCWYRVSIYPI